MKYTDENIREIFSQKLGDFESHVPGELWNAVSSQIGQPVVAAPAVAAKVIAGKLFWAAAIAVITAGSITAYFLTRKENGATEAPAKTVTIQNTTPLSENTVPLTDDQQAAQQAPVVPGEARNNSLSEDPRNVYTSSLSADRNTDVINSSTDISEPSAVTERSVNNAGVNDNSNILSRTQDQPVGENSPAKHIADEEASTAFTATFKVVTVSKDDLRFFFIPQAVNAKVYEWDLGDGTTSSEMSPVHQYDEDGDYTVNLKVTDAAGNTKPFTQVVNAMKPAKLVIPDIFTPNGDGLNETFDLLEKSTHIKLSRIIVFNQDGKKVFESDGNIMWDGNDMFGNACPVGRYNFSVIAFDDRNHEMLERSDVVTLKR